MKKKMLNIVCGLIIYSLIIWGKEIHLYKLIKNIILAMLSLHIRFKIDLYWSKHVTNYFKYLGSAVLYIYAKS